MEIEGFRVGDTAIVYTIIEGSDCKASGGHTISSKEIRVRVRLPTSVRIPDMENRKVDSGSFLKAQAILVYGQEDFNHGVAPIMYAWSSDTPKTMSIINTTRKEMMSVHGVDSKDTDEVVMKHQYIRNNSKN